MTPQGRQNKGKEGERHIAKILNGILIQVMRELQYPEEKINAAATSVQRNQNQSAVGGSDLSNTFGLAIEVKRQEALSIGSWWEQCTAAAKRNSEHPVLLYRQNHQTWKCVTYGWAPLPNGGLAWIRVQMEFDQFMAWYRHWIRIKLQDGAEVRT